MSSPQNPVPESSPSVTSSKSQSGARKTRSSAAKRKMDAEMEQQVPKPSDEHQLVTELETEAEGAKTDGEEPGVETESSSPDLLNEEHVTETARTESGQTEPDQTEPNNAVTSKASETETEPSESETVAPDTEEPTTPPTLKAPKPPRAPKPPKAPPASTKKADNNAEDVDAPATVTQQPQNTVAASSTGEQRNTTAQRNTPSSTASSASAKSAGEQDADHDTGSDTGSTTYQHPIPPASEPMQYRAIGLVRGIYTPSEEQFTRGEMLTDDGEKVEAVLLGRVMSLVRKHIALDESHLWVVYPRTRAKSEGLHLQIVGVWEPETLNQETLNQNDQNDHQDATPDTEVDLSDETSSDKTSVDMEQENTVETSNVDAEAVTEAVTEEKPVSEVAGEPGAAQDTTATPSPQSGAGGASPSGLQDGYFSIRGEVVYHSEEEEKLIVKIQQRSRKADQPGKSFQVHMKGKLDGKSVGYFWDLNAIRQGDALQVQDGTMIAMVPPKKKQPGERGGKRPFNRGGGKFNKPRGNFRGKPSGRDDRGDRKGPTPKPVRRSSDQSSTTPE